MKKYKVAIIGSGSLGSIIGNVVARDFKEEYKILGVLSGRIENAEKLANAIESRAYKTLDELLDDKPDYIIEAASPDVFKAIGVKVLAHGISIIPLSVGALADKEFYEKAKQAALNNKSRIHIPTGAVGGLDVLRGAVLMEDVEVRITTEKSPKSLNGAPFLKGRKLSEEKAEEIFSGSAKEAIAHFPENVNVAVATALAATGVEKTKVTIKSIPGLKSNRHTIQAVGETIQISATVETTPSEANPKSSSLAAYSVVGLLMELAAPIRF